MCMCLCLCRCVFLLCVSMCTSISLTTRTGSQGCSLHSVGKKNNNKIKPLRAQNPPPPRPVDTPPPPHYCSTWPRVSGSLRARKLPAASAPEAKRMGTALVMPTNEVKMLMPRTAASLQSALRNPNAVVLPEKSG